MRQAEKVCGFRVIRFFRLVTAGFGMPTGVREIVSVPAKRPIKPVYVKQFVALIDAVGGIGKK